MIQAIFIPKLGLTMEDATVIEWQASDGDYVTKGQQLLTIETDKIMFDIEAEAEGFLHRVALPNARVLVGELAGELYPSKEAAIKATRAFKTVISDSTNTTSSDTSALNSPALPDPTSSNLSRHPAKLSFEGNGRIMVSPVARVLASEKQVDLQSVRGSGPGGVILLRDIEATPQKPSPKVSPIIVNVDSATASTRQPITPMRRAISQRMMASLSKTAQMTGFGRIDMGEVQILRESLVAQEAQLGVRITYTDIVLKAVALVLQDMPEINAYIYGDDIVILSHINIGLAVSVEGGLVVPVIRHVNRLSLVELAHKRIELIEKSRNNRLAPEDVTGGSFTLSNFGSYGGDFETPILNAPQSALLGIGQIALEPAVRKGQVVARPLMWISLTFDHRLIDGALAGRFRARLRELLEQPAGMLAHLR